MSLFTKERKELQIKSTPLPKEFFAKTDPFVVNKQRSRVTAVN